MASATVLQVVDIVNGGSANKGQDVWFELRVNDGKKEQNLGFFITHDMLPILITHLITYGGMSRNTRMGKNPNEERDGTYASGHALGLVNAYAGRSVTDPRYGLLTLQFDAGQGRRLNLYCAADAAGLDCLRAACDATADMLKASTINKPTAN